MSEEDFVELARKSLRFLESYSPVRIRVLKLAQMVKVAYVLEPLTVEISYEIRDDITDILVCRTVDGDVPPGYMFSGGRRMRWSLDEALRLCGVSERAAAARLVMDMKHSWKNKKPSSWRLALQTATLKHTIRGLTECAEVLFE